MTTAMHEPIGRTVVKLHKPSRFKRDCAIAVTALLWSMLTVGVTTWAHGQSELEHCISLASQGYEPKADEDGARYWLKIRP